MQLSDRLLNEGRTLVVDNFYTSLELANLLLDKRTHLLGTLRTNRRGNPIEVTQKKLKKGETYGLENDRGICIIKWHDKRDVLILTTKHKDEVKEINRYSGKICKPLAIIDYNAGKSSIDLSDQMSSYSTALRRKINIKK